MVELGNKKQIETLLDGPFDLNTTPERMETIIASGLPWYLKVREYQAEPIDGDTSKTEKETQIRGEQIGEWNSMIDQPSKVIGVEVCVAEEPKDPDAEVKYFVKPIYTGMGAQIVGIVSDPDRLDHVVGNRKKKIPREPIAATHIKEWCDEHNLDTSKVINELVPDIVRARGAEIVKLLNQIAEKKQQYDDSKLSGVASIWRVADEEKRKAERLA